MSTTYKLLKLEEITVDQGLQVRKALDEPTVERYAAMIGEGAKFPPLICGWVHEQGPIYLIDGFHRHAAYSQLPTEILNDCFVKNYDSFEDMFEDALLCNMKHGLNLTEEERRDAIQKVIQRHPEESLRQLADRCGCSKSAISKYMNQLSTRGQFERPEKVVGKDGKVRPATVTRKYEKPAIIAPPKPIEEDIEEPFDFQPREDEETPQPKTPVHFCAGGCGTPIWEEMKTSPDCSYVEQDGRWFCSEECAQAYMENDAESEPDPETAQEETIVTCKHCGKTTTRKDALDYLKSGWQPLDGVGNVSESWCCSEECLDAEMGEPAVKPEKKRRAEAKPEPEPEPEKEAPVDPAALHVPQCPFSKFHHPKLEKVSNNGYRVRCPECDKEGRIVRTYVEKSWRKAHQAWGRYDNETKTLEELLEESDY